MACPLVSGNLKDDLIFIVFVSQERFFHISSGGAAALQSVTCQVKPNESWQTPQRGWLLTQCWGNTSSLPVKFQGLSTLPGWCLLLFLKSPLRSYQMRKKHQPRSLICVCVIRDQLVSGLKLLCVKVARPNLAINEMENFRGHWHTVGML